MIVQTIIFAVLLLIMWTIVILLVWQDGREKTKPVRHGRWIEVQNTGLGNTAECSVCGKKMYGYIGANYCPSCGARMDGNRVEMHTVKTGMDGDSHEA